MTLFIVLNVIGKSPGIFPGALNVVQGLNLFNVHTAEAFFREIIQNVLIAARRQHRNLVSAFLVVD
jgi:hypothetical protein